MKSKKRAKRTYCLSCGHQRGRHHDNLCGVKDCHCMGYAPAMPTTVPVQEVRPVDQPQ